MDNEIPFEGLPEAEQKRLVEEFEAQLAVSNARARRENLVLETKVKRLEALADAQEKIADEMERLAEQSRRIRAETDSLLAA